MIRYWFGKSVGVWQGIKTGSWSRVRSGSVSPCQEIQGLGYQSNMERVSVPGPVPGRGVGIRQLLRFKEEGSSPRILIDIQQVRTQCRVIMGQRCSIGSMSPRYNLWASIPLTLGWSGFSLVPRSIMIADHVSNVVRCRTWSYIKPYLVKHFLLVDITSSSGFSAALF